MPEAGTQCYLCDLPIRFDTYDGCSHACEYCFAKKFKDISQVKNGESANALSKFIIGQRNRSTDWCDWNIPLHWGGMSDPFQPCEKTRRVSYECLKVFAQTQYPFVVSTKGKLIVENEYLDLIEKCNCVVQISAVCRSYNKLEQGAPTYEERLEMARKISQRGKRVIFRMQPYMHEIFDEVYNNLEEVKEAGVYGIIIEGMKYRKKKAGLVKISGDFCYPYQVIKEDFLKLKQKAHKLGLKIYAGENRIRIYGDSLTCCGIDGLEGFKPNRFNLNHILNGDNQQPTEKMKELGTGRCFRSLVQNTVKGGIIEKNSFAYNMINTYKERKKTIDELMGVTDRKNKR